MGFRVLSLHRPTCGWSRCRCAHQPRTCCPGCLVASHLSLPLSRTSADDQNHHDWFSCSVWGVVECCCFFPFFPQSLYALEQFQVQSKTEGKGQRFPYAPAPHMHGFPHYQHPSPARAVPLSQPVTLHGHVITTQNPSLTVGCTLGVVCSMGWDKCTSWF